MRIKLYADDAMTYTLSAVTFRMSITSHSPEVIAVALPCRRTQCVWVLTCFRKIYCAMYVKSQCDIGLLPKINHSTYLDHMMDVLVLIGVAHQQVIAVLVCGKNWF